MSVTIRNRVPQRDPIARAHHRVLVAKMAGYGLLAFVILGGGVWLLFSSAFLAVTIVEVEGVSGRVSHSVQSMIGDVLGKRAFGFFHPARNILLLDEQGVAQMVRSTFQNIEEVRVEKRYPHTLHIQAKERVPVGTWCRMDGCQYFDSSGVRWGVAISSTGPLLLLVRDERATASENDQRIFTNIMKIVGALPALGLRPVTVTLPNTAPGDLAVHTQLGYDVLLDALADTRDQLDTLAVFIVDKAKDPAWKPQYIDLRTPGRVYYK